MSQAFMKALKWYFLTIMVIIGTSAMIVSQETNSVRPVIVAILGYGVAYIMASFWRDFRGRLLFVSLLVFMVISAISTYQQEILFVLFGITEEYNRFLVWGVAMGILGVPAMTLVFRKYD